MLRKLKWQITGKPLASRYNWCQGPVLGYGPTVEKHCSRARYWTKDWKIRVAGRRGSRGKQLLDDLKDKNWYWKLKEGALDRTFWRAGCGGGYETVVRQTTEWVNEKWMNEWMNADENSVYFPTYQKFIYFTSKFGGCVLATFWNEFSFNVYCFSSLESRHT